MKKIAAFVAECFDQNVTSIDWTLEYFLDRCDLLWRHFSRRVAALVIRRITRRLMWGVTSLCTAGMVPGFAGPVVHAQNPADNFMHWGYASYFGTGWYSVGNDLDVFAICAAPRWNWGEPRLDDEGNRDIGIELRVPVTFSVHQFNSDNLAAVLDVDNFGTVSLTPGVTIPSTRGRYNGPTPYQASR